MSKLKTTPIQTYAANFLCSQEQSVMVNRKKFQPNVNRLLSLWLLLGLLLFSACNKEEGTVVLIDQEEFNVEERKIISLELQNKINENPRFSVLSPQGSADITAFYEYLNRSYQSLVNTERVTNRNKLDWSIHVLEDDEQANTFITPGGAMYITTRMLKTIRTEHELINILAHEMMYADGDLLLGKLKSEYGGDVLFQIIAGNNPSELAGMARALPDIAYSESEVLAADSYAVDIICDFLYDPHGMRDFLQRIIRNEENLYWMQNRPSSEDRYILVEQSASGCGPGGTFESRYQDFISKLP